MAAINLHPSYRCRPFSGPCRASLRNAHRETSSWLGAMLPDKVSAFFPHRPLGDSIAFNLTAGHLQSIWQSAPNVSVVALEKSHGSIFSHDCPISSDDVPKNVPVDFLRRSHHFPILSHYFPSSSYIFPSFSYIVPSFSIIVLHFPMLFQYLPLFSNIFRWFSHKTTIFLWFSYDFPIKPPFSHDFSMVNPGFCTSQGAPAPSPGGPLRREPGFFHDYDITWCLVGPSDVYYNV